MTVAPHPSLSRPARQRRLTLDALDYTLFLPGIWLACGLGISFRLIGPLFAIVPVGLCLLYAILRRTVPPRLLTSYIAVCIGVAVLSKYQLMPTSWQVYFYEDAIVRQLIPPLGYFAVAWASKAYFRRRLASGDVFRGAPVILILSFVVAPAIMFQQGVGYQGDRSIYSLLAYFGALVNFVSIAMFFVLGGIFIARGWRRGVALLVFLGIALTTHFAHFKVFAMGAIAIFVGVPARKAVIGLLTILIGAYAIGLNFIPEVTHKDPNSGLRLALVEGALSSAVDTYGLGIGYGKESVRWVYRIPGRPDFTYLPDPRSMTHARMLEALSTGVENSFAQALLRTGLPGFVLLVAAFAAAFPPANLPRDVRNHAAALFTLTVVGCFVNSALESPLSVVGHGFVYGYLIALRAEARLHRVKRVGPTRALVPARLVPAAGRAAE